MKLSGIFDLEGNIFSFLRLRLLIFFASHSRLILSYKLLLFNTFEDFAARHPDTVKDPNFAYKDYLHTFARSTNRE